VQRHLPRPQDRQRQLRHLWQHLSKGLPLLQRQVLRAGPGQLRRCLRSSDTVQLAPITSRRDSEWSSYG
jgi:hypothetical protein